MTVTTGHSILLAEDDDELRGMLAQLLEDEGYDVSVAADGQSALRLALSAEPDLLVLDRGLPHLEGLDLLSRLRRVGWTVPVLVLSAYGTARDRVAGLDAGAEDYLSKPFDVDELLARVRALLRRHLDSAECLRIVGGVFDPLARSVEGPDRTVQLSAREAALLELLAGRPQRVFARAEIRSRVFGEADSDSVVDTYVHYLRRKLGRDVIRTVHGVGYRVGAPVPARRRA